jgi:hypothetical protein
MTASGTSSSSGNAASSANRDASSTSRSWTLASMHSRIALLRWVSFFGLKTNGPSRARRPSNFPIASGRVSPRATRSRSQPFAIASICAQKPRRLARAARRSAGVGWSTPGRLALSTPAASGARISSIGNDTLPAGRTPGSRVVTSRMQFGPPRRNGLSCASRHTSSITSRIRDSPRSSPRCSEAVTMSVNPGRLPFGSIFSIRSATRPVTSLRLLPISTRKMPSENSKRTSSSRHRALGDAQQ